MTSFVLGGEKKTMATKGGGGGNSCVDVCMLAHVCRVLREPPTRLHQW